MSVESRPSLSINPQTLVGLLVVAAGLLLLAENLGLMRARQVLAYWPVRISTLFPIALVIVGVVIIQRALGLRGGEAAGNDQSVSEFAL